MRRIVVVMLTEPFGRNTTSKYKLYSGWEHRASERLGEIVEDAEFLFKVYATAIHEGCLWCVCNFRLLAVEYRLFVV